MSDKKTLNDAQRQLISDNIKLVYHVIRKHFSSFQYDDEIISCGKLGLCKAALKWDESKSLFSTFACQCIRNEILLELRLRRKQRNADILSLDYPIGEDLTLGDAIEGGTLEYCDDTWISKLNEDEKWIVSLFGKGYNIHDIRRVTGYNEAKIRRIKRNARTKYEQYM